MVCWEQSYFGVLDIFRDKTNLFATKLDGEIVAWGELQYSYISFSD
jgi:hypothetical protein